ncbi:hypothetical protein BO221_10525 [Archangium sp. Cb G35]|uniref:hypothetical protein n=1 Tax=Archangium sp. Cb G35 TaxID=1920190 RepID=UPI000937EEFD|nr:hypothetical protein [Archangium sp. Cb G35]OJT24835.1 hypothetical protein BO221_10525 [Archangium sp. Cb G35]
MPSSVVFTPDDTDWRPPGAGPGLLLDVPGTGPWLRRPSFHVEATPVYRLRVSSGGLPLLWLRIDEWWSFCGFLRGHALAPGVIPPLPVAEVRGIPHEPGTSAWWESWTWQMARALAQSPQPVLHVGRWCLRPLQAVTRRESAPYPCVPSGLTGGPADPPHSLEGVLRWERFWVEEWSSGGPPGDDSVSSGAVLPLRAPSAAEDGRVKSWRKHARSGTLPPALLLYLEIAGKWLVLDGHDRLHAALLEGVPPPLLGLWPVFEKTVPEDPVRREGVQLSVEVQLRSKTAPEVIDRANRALVREFRGLRRAAVTRTWLLPGGAEAWRLDVLSWRRQHPLVAKEGDWDWFVSPRLG